MHTIGHVYDAPALFRAQAVKELGLGIKRKTEDRSPIMCQLCSYVAQSGLGRRGIRDGLCVAVAACRKRQAEGRHINKMLDAEDAT